MATLFHILTSTIINPPPIFLGEIPHFSWLNPHFVGEIPPPFVTKSAPRMTAKSPSFSGRSAALSPPVPQHLPPERWWVEGNGWKSFSWYPTTQPGYVKCFWSHGPVESSWIFPANGGSFHSFLYVYQRVDGFFQCLSPKKKNDFTAVYSYQ